jgi:hypothetical protein
METLTKHKTVLPVDLKHKLTTHHSKPPHLYDFKDTQT